MRRWQSGAVVLAATLLILGIAELCLRVFAPVPDPYAKYKQGGENINQYVKSDFPPHFRLPTKPEPGLSGVQGPNVFTTNNKGFRGDSLAIPKPPQEFRVFMVGGSTTECLYLDDSESITSVLQQRLNDRGPHNLVVRVYGASKSGDATDDHISMIAHRLVHLEPDMLIVFSGINDLSRSIYNYDYSHYSSQASLAKYSLVKLWATEFQISRRVYLLLKRLFPPAQDVLQTITGTSNYREKIRIRESVAVSNERPRTDLVSYATNLRTIIGIAKSQGIPLVFMTQQTTWDGPAEAKKWHWMVHRNGVTYRDDFMNEAMESLNDAMRELAIENDIPLYDLARSMPKSLDLMYDDVHFTERGAALAAEELASLILEKQMIRRAGTDVAVRSNPTE